MEKIGPESYLGLETIFKYEKKALKEFINLWENSNKLLLMASTKAEAPHNALLGATKCIKRHWKLTIC